MSRITSLLMGFCGVELTVQKFIEKTLSTFPVSALMIAKKYRLECNARQITRFHQLIIARSAAEKHDNILVKNYNSRLVGNKRVHEVNYNSAPKGGHKEGKPKFKAQQNRRVGPYNRPTKEGNCHIDVRTRGNVDHRGEASTSLRDI
ncbi:uncharacterized protein LOC112171263 [Rosa chinensis]|uniref:uncharacterized protein LOC112171263 n=1 Tax=Rosa chinensis TaxID=74649 RepID=UPI000D095F3B|nr:uncharacterized protein LOC112171263 [Rosa chinensis]